MPKVTQLVNQGTQMTFRSSCSKSRVAGVWVTEAPHIGLHCLCGKSILDNQRPQGFNSSADNYNYVNLLGNFSVISKVLKSSSYIILLSTHPKAMELCSPILQVRKPWLLEVK